MEENEFSSPGKVEAVPHFRIDSAVNPCILICFVQPQCAGKK